MPDLDRLTKRGREMYELGAVTTTGGVIYLRKEHLIELKTLDELWEWLRANIFTEASE